MKNHFIIKNIIQQGENKLWAHNKNTRRNPFILISCGVIHIPNLKIQIHKIQVKEFRETFWVDNLYIETDTIETGANISTTATTESEAARAKKETVIES